ncbi:GNAT family N-acetyltransferase [Actinomadura kijaniata]|uniref:GNAT family N-acetyltransferase n=1 Tax=Actinomadura kijaniata TaxID=46161 RepID=UPI003F1AB4FB
MSTTTTLDIRLGLPADARPAAAALYWEAFSRKAGPVLDGPRRAGFVAESLVPGRVLGAWDGDRLLGVAFLQQGGGAPLDLSLRRLVREFGPVRGLWRGLLARCLASTTPDADELMIDSLAVSGAARGRGVGGALLDAVVGQARARGLRRVRLEVVDTNPRARALYERFGFRAGETVRTPYLRRLMGFGAVTTMRYDVEPEPVSAG